MMSRLKSICFLAGAGLMIGASGGCEGTVVVHEHLASVKAVALYVEVRGGDAALRSITEQELKKRTTQILTQEAIMIKDGSGPALEIHVAVMPPTRGPAKGFAANVTVQLREDVALKRDSRLLVPEGALTWWKQAILLADSKQLSGEIGRSAENLVREFVEAVRLAGTMSSTKKDTPP